MNEKLIKNNEKRDFFLVLDIGGLADLIRNWYGNLPESRVRGIEGRYETSTNPNIQLVQKGS